MYVSFCVYSVRLRASSPAFRCLPEIFHVFRVWVIHSCEDLYFIQIFLFCILGVSCLGSNAPICPVMCFPLFPVSEGLLIRPSVCVPGFSGSVNSPSVCLCLFQGKNLTTKHPCACMYASVCILSDFACFPVLLALASYLPRYFMSLVYVWFIHVRNLFLVSEDLLIRLLCVFQVICLLYVCVFFRFLRPVNSPSVCFPGNIFFRFLRPVNSPSVCFPGNTPSVCLCLFQVFKTY